MDLSFLYPKNCLNAGEPGTRCSWDHAPHAHFLLPAPQLPSCAHCGMSRGTAHTVVSRGRQCPAADIHVAGEGRARRRGAWRGNLWGCGQRPDNPGGALFWQDNAAARTTSPRRGPWAAGLSRAGLQAVLQSWDSPCAGRGGSTAAPQASASLGAGAHRSRLTQSPHCHSPRGAGWDPNIWPQSVSPASAGAAGVAEQLVGGKVPFLPFWLLEKGALSSFRVLLLGLFSCLSSRGCCAIGSETKGAQKNKSKLRLEGWAAIAGSGECGIRFLCLYGLTAFFFLLLWEASLATQICLQMWAMPCKTKPHSLPERF